MLEKAVAVNYSSDQFLKSYLATAQKAVCLLASEYDTAAKYDKPCCTYDERVKKGLFLKFVLENIDCYTTDEKNKVISIANRFAQNCGYCTVSQSEVDAFAATSLGQSLVTKFNA
jgi:hypothetical protein